MFLKRLEIHGFKSFGEKTVFDFTSEKGAPVALTAIVGPNGSGKSNVADAVRWVLGEQSMKSLRGKHAEQLLFDGTACSSVAARASVKMIFNNTCQSLPIEYSEVVVERLLFRSKGGEYRLNGARVRLVDIQTLLAHGRISQRSYCIVTQGLADAILRANPLERRLLLEDAIGVKPYQIKKKRAQQKLIRSQRHLLDAQGRLEEMMPRLRLLKREASKIEQKQELEKTLRIAQEEHYSTSWLFYTSEIVRLQEQIDQLNKRIHKHRVSSDDSTLQVKQLKRERDELQQQQQKLSSLARSCEDVVREQQQKLALVRAEMQLCIQQSEQGSKPSKTASVSPLRLQELDFSLSQLRSKMLNENNALQEVAEKKKGLLAQIDEYRIIVREKKVELSSLEKKQQEMLWDSEKLSSVLRDFVKRQRSFFRLLLSVITKKEITELQEEAKSLNVVVEDISKHGLQTKEQLQQTSAWRTIKADIIQYEALIDTARARLSEFKMAIHGHETTKSLYEDQEKALIKQQKSLQEEMHTAVECVDSSSVFDGLREKEELLQKKLISLEKERDSSLNQQQTLRDQEQAAYLKLEEYERLGQQFLRQTVELSSELQELELAMRSAQVRRDDLEADFTRILGIRFLETLRAKTIDLKQVYERSSVEQQAKVERLQARVYAIGDIDPLVAEEYVELSERSSGLSQQTEDLTTTIASLEDVIARLDETIESLFTAAFSDIQTAFSHYFSLLFDGGEAKLALVDLQNDDDEEGVFVRRGVTIDLALPDKAIRSLELLSGGERAIASLALLFAIMSINPPPFSILDEVEAALDESNTARFGAILRELSKDTQFIIITHKRETMRIADVLYGVTMNTVGASELLSVQLDSFPDSSFLDS